MSLLLDALNKADQERKRNETTPGISSNHERRGDDEPRGYPLLLIVAGAVGLILLLAVIYWLGQRSTAPVTTRAPAITSTMPAETSNKKTVAPNAAKPAETPQEQQTTQSADSASNADENVADLYQQNNQVPPSNASITISAPQPEPAQPAPEPVQATPEPAPAIPENIVSPTSITQFANLPELHDLPNNILDKVPTLTYSEHNYNANDGSVKINGAIFHVNEQIANGIVIDKILEDGMILHIDNYPFKMRAMNSWINM